MDNSGPFLIVHKIAHGGDKVAPVELIDARVEAAIADMAVVTSVHNPPMLQGIKAMRAVNRIYHRLLFLKVVFIRQFPNTHRFTVFRLSLAEKYGLRKYGFHGASHKYISEKVSSNFRLFSY